MGIGSVIIFLSCNDGTFYPGLCETIVSSFGFTDPKIILFFLDQPMVGHALFYALLTFILLHVVNIPLGILIAFSFGGILEIIQVYLPTRQALLNDFWADGVGVLCAVLVFQSILWINPPTMVPDEK